MSIKLVSIGEEGHHLLKRTPHNSDPESSWAKGIIIHGGAAVYNHTFFKRQICAV
jgi:hypothetical protein